MKIYNLKNFEFKTNHAAEDIIIISNQIFSKKTGLLYICVRLFHIE